MTPNFTIAGQYAAGNIYDDLAAEKRAENLRKARTKWVAAGLYVFGAALIVTALAIKSGPVPAMAGAGVLFIVASVMLLPWTV